VVSIIQFVIGAVAIKAAPFLPTHCPLRPFCELRPQRRHGDAKPWRLLWALWHDRRPLSLRIALVFISFFFFFLLLLFNLVVSIIQLVIGAVAIKTVPVLPTHCPLRPLAELRLQGRHGYAKPRRLLGLLRQDRRPLHDL